MNVNHHILFFLLFICLNISLSAVERYVSPTGNDTTGNGTITSPWKTIQYGIDHLVSGETVLNVFAGTYRESYIGIKYASRNGTLLKTIGGKAQITNDITVFNDADTSAGWNATAYDATRKIYKSTNAYVGGTDNYAYGYFNYSGKNYKLVPYTSWTAFTSGTFSEGQYIGPGTFYDKNGEHGTAGLIYIRLAKTEQMDWLSLGTIENSHPNALKIYLSVVPPWLQIWQAANVTVDGVDLSNGRITIGGPAPDTTIRNCSITGLYAPTAESAIQVGTESCILDNIRITDNFPEWVCWEDVKVFSANYSLMNSAIQVACDGLDMRKCYIKDVHDGIWATDVGQDWDIHDNVFENIQDDGIQLSAHSAKINIHHNAFVSCGTSVSKNAYDGNPTNPYPGEKYIHHNLIDTQKPRYWYRRNSGGTFDGGNNQGKLFIEAFGQHNFLYADIYKDPRKIYNNTILAGYTIGAGRYGSNMAGVQSTIKHEIYNNIMYVDVPVGFPGAYMENASDESNPASHSTKYDGNCHYFTGARADPNRLYHGYMLSGIPDIYDFEDLKLHSNNTWESGGAWLNPQFNADKVPLNSSIDTVGIALSSFGWPDVTDTDYCGAFKRIFGNSINKLDPIVENAGFESDYSDTWSCSTGVTRDTIEHQRGACSLKITSTTTVLRSAEFKTYQPVIPGRAYKARIYIKGNNIGTASSGALMKFVFIKEDGTSVNGAQTSPKNGTFDWQEFAATSTAPANAVALKLRLCLYDTGDVWFDNVQLFQLPNICPNPGFESDVSSDYVLGSTCSQASDYSYSGKSSLRGTAASGGYAMSSTVIERLPVTPGKKIKITIYAMTENISGSGTIGAQIKTEFYNSSKSYLGDSSRLSSSLLPGTNNWTMLKNEGTIPSGAAYAVVTLRLYGTAGTVWFDDLHVLQE